MAVMIGTGGLSLTTILLRGARGAFAPARLFGLLFAFFFVLVPVLQVLFDATSPHHVLEPTAGYASAAIATWVFGLGVAGGMASKRGHKRKVEPLASVEHSPKYLRPTLIGVMTTGLLAWIAYFHALGGATHLLNNVQNKTALAAGHGHLSSLGILLQVGSLASVAFLTKRQSPVWKLVVVAASVMAVVPLLLLGMRSRVLMHVLALGTIAHYVHGLRITKVRLTFAFIALVVTIVVLGEVRSLGTGAGAILDGGAISSSFQEQELTLRRTLVDFGHFERIALVTEYVPEHLPLQLGKTFASALTMPLPRRFFPAKPTGSGPIMANAINPGAWDLEKGWVSGVTITLLGEAYLNFWWPGLFLVGVLFGAWAQASYRNFETGIATRWTVVAYSLVAVYGVLGLALGEFAGSMMFYVLQALPVYLLRRAFPDPALEVRPDRTFLAEVSR